VTDFLQNAESILETALSADSVELESSNLAIVIGQDGAISMWMGTDWPLDSLHAHHGARAAYRVSRTASQVRVEGKSRARSCLLQSEPAASVARRMLADPWQRHSCLSGSGAGTTRALLPARTSPPFWGESD